MIKASLGFYRLTEAALLCLRKGLICLRLKIRPQATASKATGTGPGLLAYDLGKKYLVWLLMNVSSGKRLLF